MRGAGRLTTEAVDRTLLLAPIPRVTCRVDGGLDGGTCCRGRRVAPVVVVKARLTQHVANDVEISGASLNDHWSCLGRAGIGPRPPASCRLVANQTIAKHRIEEVGPVDIIGIVAGADIPFP